MIQFELVTLEGTKYSEEVYEVILPTPDGEIAVLPNHIPLVSIASPGVIGVRKRQIDSDNDMEFFATNGGVIEVVGHTLRVLVDDADRENEINLQEAEKAYERAQELKIAAKDSVELDKAQSLVDLQQSRIKVASLRRHKRR